MNFGVSFFPAAAALLVKTAQSSRHTSRSLNDVLHDQKKKKVLFRVQKRSNRLLRRVERRGTAAHRLGNTLCYVSVSRANKSTTTLWSEFQRRTTTKCAYAAPPASEWQTRKIHREKTAARERQQGTHLASTWSGSRLTCFNSRRTQLPLRP